MSSIARRANSPVAEMLEWLESGFPTGFRPFGLAHFVHVEDYVEDSTYVLRVELPGIDPERDVQLEVQGDALVVKGERREEKKEKQRQEFRYGSFHRVMTLPAGARAEEITASYQDGVLEVRIPISEETPQQAKSIPITRR
jgi:HSP20 family molecular chaperone IbpA